MTIFKAGDPIVVCGGKYNNKVGRIREFNTVKVLVKLRAIDAPVHVYQRQLRLRSATIENHFVFVPETVLEKSHAIAMSLYVCNYNEEESVAVLQHVMDRINRRYNELRGDMDDE